MNIIKQRITTAEGQVKFREYQKKQHLGQGGFANCYEVKRLDDGKQFAMKVINKNLLLKSEARSKMLSEIQLHRRARHKNICQIYGVFEDDCKIYILMQLCRNQTLFSLISKRKKLTTPETQYYIHQLAQAICYLHERNIVHRDLKLGNVLLDQHLNVKLSDFGLATKIQFPGDRKHSLCGTPNYIAPEIIRFGLNVQNSHSGHSYEVDIWSLGVILYILLIGETPFDSDSRAKTYKKVCNAQFSFPKSFKDQKAKDLIRKILVVDPCKRFTLQQILEHPFMNPAKGIPKEIPLTALKTDPNLTQFERIENDDSLRESAKNINLSSVRSTTHLDFDFLPEQSKLRHQNCQLQQSSIQTKQRTLKAVCSYGTLPKSIQKLTSLKKCFSYKNIPIFESSPKIQSAQQINSPKALDLVKLSASLLDYKNLNFQHRGKTTMPTNANLSIQNQECEQKCFLDGKTTVSSEQCYVVKIKKDIIWSYVLKNGFIGTYEKSSESYRLLFDKKLKSFIEIAKGQLLNVVSMRNIEKHQDILNRKKFIDQHLDDVQVQNCNQDCDYEPIYIDKMIEIRGEPLLLFILSNKTIQLFNHQDKSTLVKIDDKFLYVHILDGRQKVRIRLTQRQASTSNNSSVQYLYSKMKKVLAKISKQ